MLNKILKTIISLSFIILALPGFADEPEDISNWSAKFAVGPNHKYVATHCPGQVCLDMMCAAEGLHLEANTKFNGIHISPSCDLDIKVKMSKEDFIAALQCAGLEPVEMATA